MPDSATPYDERTAAKKPRIAIVHEWLVGYAGSERVVRELLTIYPEADLFAVVDFFSDEDRTKIYGKRATTTFIQKLPFAKTHYRSYLPLMPIAIEQLDVSAYDIVISSSHAVAKGVLTGPDQTHICICYTPIRYAWDMHGQYLHESNLDRGLRSFFARLGLHYIRVWDVRTASGVDQFVAISKFVQRRIKKVYGRDSTVIYPPVNIELFPFSPAPRENFYLAASRLVPHKRMDLIVEAFQSMPDRQLIVIGDGPHMPKLRQLAGLNVTIMGYQPDDVLLSHLQRARAFIFAAEEDQGFLPIEAQATGTPVIALGKGGALETVIGYTGANIADATGVFFEAQTPESLIAGVARFEVIGQEISPLACRRQAEKFSVAAFRAELREFIHSHASEAAAGRLAQTAAKV